MDPAIDRTHLAAQTCGDSDLAREVLGLFARQCRDLLPGIADAGLDAPTRADLAHTLKGSALGVGALGVAGASTIVEEALRQGRDSADPVRILEARVAAALEEIMND
ncbi:Hpt domain-containing protein [Methylobacterium planeticum]|uniref:HPt domain-containing protein n=1 Tax=Methylobacterium planeticum TaxID=2615211 RepID=A0A6N6MYX6_9HYPH|nr:Hpt domain-containing protein [Methylobacterium planeticum]KAB1074682.1 hypothetical protein F6X51_06010 [Methylobacterium planeticum]